MSRSITITIINETDESRPSPDLESNDSVSQKPNPENKAKSDKNKRTVGDLMKVYVVRRVYQIAKSTATQYMNKHFDASEDYHAATLVDNASSTVDYFVDSFTGAVAAGKAFELAGATFGMGVGIGLATVAMAKLVSSVNQYANEAQNLVNSAYGNYFYGQRAGFIAGGHGTEN